MKLIMVFPADWNDFMLVLQVALGYFLHIHVLVIIILAMAHSAAARNNPMLSRVVTILELKAFHRQNIEN